MKFSTAAISLIAAVSTSADGSLRNTGERSLQDMSLLELVKGTTLETAVGLADLTEALSGDGPFTVLAPSDDAFTGVPAKYLAPNHKFHLQNVLLFHVIDGTVMSGDLTNGMTPATLNEETLNVGVADTVTFGPSLTGTATVTTADVAATNGVAHIIDDVLTPSFLSNSVVDLATAGGLTTLLDAATAAGLADTLGMEGNYTVLAPTNEAFAAVDNLDAILADTDLLTQILQFHVLPDIVHSSQLTGTGATGTLLDSAEVSFAVEGESVSFMGQNTAKVVSANLLANNGIVHVIDAVLLPPMDDDIMAPSAAVGSLLSGLCLAGVAVASAALF